MRKKLLLLSFALFHSALFSQATTLINGAGATFPYPLYSRWFSDYQKVSPTTQINYQSIGSGGGIRQFTDKTIDFGATDSPMTDEQLKKVGEPVIHIPTAIGSVVVSYNLPNQKKLKLNSDLIAAIFLGDLKKWEDPRLKKLNPDLSVSGDIVVIHRSDGSGTTAVFTDYLAKVSPQWKEKVGTGTSVKFPVGLGGKGNEGVAGLIKQTPLSLGYIEFVYAKTNQLPVSTLQNAKGEFVEPTLASLTAAANAMMGSMPQDYRLSITNSAGKGSYPLSSFTYLLIRQDMSGSEKGTALVGFLKWALKEGQKTAAALEYAPLPAALEKKLQNTVQTIKVAK
ncbi:MAG: phosphate ABC transporter substrate-binding protein PstS [Proteobacteria bacterium]|nr:phosphate ABC transporter substrate-binding protein PstS [Pseudomonadota bacterium]